MGGDNVTLFSTITPGFDNHTNDSLPSLLINDNEMMAHFNKSGGAIGNTSISFNFTTNSSTNLLSHPNATDHHHQMKLNPFSLMNIMICAPMLVLQLMTLPIFLIYPNYRRNVCFRILFTNGVTDCLQLAPMLIFAILNLITDHIPIWFQMFCGSIVINAWNLLVVQHLLLAINRLIVIMRARFLGSSFFKLDEETEAKLFNAAHAFCWTLFLLIIMLHQTDLMGDLFYPGTSQFVFDIKKPYTQTIRDVFWWATVVMPIICLIIYMAIILMAKMSRNSIHQGDDKIIATRPPPLLSDYERRLLIQAFILYLVMVLLIIAWNSFSTCNGEICEGKILKVIPVSLSRTNHVYLIEGPWMIYCGLNPILFLAMNSQNLPIPSPIPLFKALFSSEMNPSGFFFALAVLFLVNVDFLHGKYNEPMARQVLQKHASQFQQHCKNARRGSAVAKCCSAIKGVMGRFTSQKKATNKILAKCKAGTTQNEAQQMRTKLEGSRKLQNCGQFKSQIQQKFSELKQYCNNGAENEEENAE
ncbi:hypothetical protein niasHT_027124 [Heterodera trifolii]|uniref:G-protein coupled receptors family 1 profile domain-containing protein n=1 Tax=Heterodera trifolii TaxID=157864 RepID=A0ABD2KAZ3_9BILA